LEESESDDQASENAVFTRDAGAVLGLVNGSIDDSHLGDFDFGGVGIAMM
jgi:hypothetical protein